MLVTNKPLIDKYPGDVLSLFSQPVEFPGASEMEPVVINTLFARICTIPPPPPAAPSLHTAGEWPIFPACAPFTSSDPPFLIWTYCQSEAR